MSEYNILLFSECITKFTFSKPVGPFLLATELRKYGYTCKVIDFYTLYTFDEWKNIINKYVSNETFIIGFSVTFLQYIQKDIIDGTTTLLEELKTRHHTIEIKPLKKYCGFELKNFLKLLNLFKEKNKKLKFIFGGVNTWNEKKQLIDFIDGYAENSLLEYVKKHDTKNIGKYNGEKFDFSKSKILWNKDDIIFPKETLPIEVSRGCIFKCKFCSFPEKGKKNFDYIKDPVILKEELERNYDLFGTTNYLFTDDTFNDSTYKLELLYNQVFSKLNFKISIAGFIRLDLLYKNREQIDILNEIGFHHINCGIESINPQTQKYIGKPFHLEKIKEITTYMREKYPIDIKAFIMFGLPYETNETLKSMYKWCMKESYKYFNRLYCQPFFILDQNTEIYKNKEKLGYILPINEKQINLNWKNKNGFTFEECTNYSLDINNKPYNDITNSGYLKLSNETINNINKNIYFDKYEKLEYMINLYKEKLLS